MSFEKTLSLGRQIAEELDDSDVLGRWMAHHISDLITRAEAAEGDTDAEELRNAATKSILELWSHRAALATRGDKPLATYDPIFTALTRLSEPQEPWRFYGLFPPGDEPDDADMVGAPLLRVAMTLEDIIRDVVRQVVVVAAEEAADREATWVALSEHLIEDDQRSVLRKLRQLRFTAATNNEPLNASQAPPSNAPQTLLKLADTLREAETSMAQVRLAVEAHVSLSAEAKPAESPNQN